jgi:alkanesulfonate monooxygenase SsuD/methylene tetrahydromethanopterin reductase-like flavin-dependent oxidoreductase (luciferase family)
MELGVVAFVTGRGLGICDVAKQVEAAGLESLFRAEHPRAGQRRGSPRRRGSQDGPSFLDPFVALGAAAAVTSRIKLGTLHRPHLRPGHPGHAGVHA